jgi:hypothetical protein
LHQDAVQALFDIVGVLVGLYTHTYNRMLHADVLKDYDFSILMLS